MGLTLIGGTLRGTTADDLWDAGNARPRWDLVRTYTYGAALRVLDTNYPNGQTPNGPRGRGIVHSFTTELPKGWSSSPAKIAALDSQLAGLPDIPSVYVDMCHEFDDPGKYATDYTTYHADATVFSARVRAVSLDRTYPFIIFRCCQAYSLTTGGRNNGRNVDPNYAEGDYDILAPDCYPPAAIALLEPYARQFGKPFAVPEFGPLTYVAHQDAPVLAHMQNGIAAWRSKAEFVLWFDKEGSGGDLDKGDLGNDYATARAYWFSLAGLSGADVDTPKARTAMVGTTTVTGTVAATAPKATTAAAGTASSTSGPLRIGTGHRDASSTAAVAVVCDGNMVAGRAYFATVGANVVSSTDANWSAADSLGNTWTRVDTVVNGTAVQVAQFYCVATVGGLTPTITFTPAAAVARVVINVEDPQVVLTALSPLDVSAKAGNNNLNIAPGTTGVRAAPGEYLYLSAAFGSGSTVTAVDSGFSLQSTDVSNFGTTDKRIQTAGRTTTDTAAVNPIMTLSASTGWAAIVAAYKLAGITGTVATTTPKATTSTAGGVTIAGTSAPTAPAMVPYIEGDLSSPATIASTAPKATASAAGATTSAGTITSTTPTATSPVVGTTTTAGVVAVTTPKAFTSNVGTTTVTGTVAATAPKAATSSQGGEGSANAGICHVTTPMVTGAVAGAAAVDGTTPATVPTATTSAAGELSVTGVTAATTPKATTSTTAIVGQAFGTITSTAPTATAAGAGDLSRSATVTTTAPAATVSATGVTGQTGTADTIAPKARAAVVGALTLTGFVHTTTSTAYADGVGGGLVTATTGSDAPMATTSIVGRLDVPGAAVGGDATLTPNAPTRGGSITPNAGRGANFTPYR